MFKKGYVMQDPEKKINSSEEATEKRRYEEKLEERSIVIGGGAAAAKKERQHGKLYRWFDNFWYHHKWKTIISLVVALIVVVCSVQMCTREPRGDVGVILAGPYNLMSKEAGYNNLRNCLSNYLAEDYDGNGAKQTDISSYSVYSKEQIQALADNKDENGDPAPIIINTQSNSSNYSSFVAYVQTGDASVMFADPWVFENMKAHLADLENTLGYVPEHAVSAEVDGEIRVLGVRLGDTALYKNNTAMQVLPADTVICLVAPIMSGNSSNPTYYARSTAYFIALTQS